MHSVYRMQPRRFVVCLRVRHTRQKTASGRSTLGPRVYRPLQIVARSPDLAVLLTHCCQLILGKQKCTFDANRCQILRLRCTKFDFCCGFAQTPLWSLQRSPDTLAAFKEQTSKGIEGNKGKGKREGRERKGKRRRREGRIGSRAPNILT